MYWAFLVSYVMTLSNYTYRVFEYDPVFSTPVELDVEANKAGKWVYKNKYM